MAGPNASRMSSLIRCDELYSIELTVGTAVDNELCQLLSTLVAALCLFVRLSGQSQKCDFEEESLFSLKSVRRSSRLFYEPEFRHPQNQLCWAQQFNDLDKLGKDFIQRCATRS